MQGFVRPATRRGFTLMELLVVLAILVLLVAMVAPRILGIQGKADIKAAKTQIGLLEGALESYAVEVGSYPTTEQGLNSLLMRPAAGGGMSMGMSSSMGTGMGIDSGMGMSTGMDPGLGMDPVMGTGMDPGLGMGADPGMGMSTGMAAPVSSGGGGSVARWDGPYLNTDSIPVDPWGIAYGYAYPPQRGAGPKPDIWSYGPDNTDGTEDDIVNWTRTGSGMGIDPLGADPMGIDPLGGDQLGGQLGPDPMGGMPPIDGQMPPMDGGMPPMDGGTLPPMDGGGALPPAGAPGQL